MGLDSLSLSATGTTADPDATTDDVSIYFSNEAGLFKLADVNVAGAVPQLPSRETGQVAQRRGRRTSSSSATSVSETKSLPQPPPALASIDSPMCGTDDPAEAELGAPPLDASRRKVRHNLTERRRVDRMNQLFHHLAMAICDETAAPAITMEGMNDAERMLTAEGKELAKPKWSKADVLEGEHTPRLRA